LTINYYIWAMVKCNCFGADGKLKLNDKGIYDVIIGVGTVVHSKKTNNYDNDSVFYASYM
jgi:hypothetical protein